MLEINYFEEIFLSTDIQGWIGPIGIVILAIMLSKKDRGIGIFFILLESLGIWYYATLLGTTPWYFWNMIILLLGVITCMLRMSTR